jgi:serine/threonine protein phosphatase PrpC
MRAVCAQRQGAKSLQEDAVLVHHASDKLVIAAVFDGHGGSLGRLASQTAAQSLPNLVQAHYPQLVDYDKDQWNNALESIFKDLHQEIANAFLKESNQTGGSLRERLKAKGLVTNDEQKLQHEDKNYRDSDGVIRRPNGYPVHGGTTATVCILVQKQDRVVLVTANVGDSDAILVHAGNSWERLSVDHGPDRKSEFLRIQALDLKSKLLFVYDKEGVYRKYECPLVFLPDGTKNPIFVQDPWSHGLRPTNVRYDPAVYAVTPPEIITDATCIAMTRSLGDFYAHPFGLSTEPSVDYRELSLDGSYAIALATDGVWDCWQYEAFAQELNMHFPCEDEENVLVGVLESTMDRARANFGRNQVDDASLILVQYRGKK